MLWRAGSGHRHPITTICHRTLLHKVSSRWLFSSVNAEHTPPRPNPPATVVTEQRGQNLHFRFTGQVQRHLFSRFPPETAALLSAIETLSSTNASRDRIITCLQTLPMDVLSNSKTVCSFALEMVDKSCPDNAVHVLHVAHRLGTLLVHSQYEQIVHRLGTRNNWRHVYIVAAMAERHTGRWTVRLLNWVVRSHLEMQQYGLLDVVFHNFERDQLTPTRRTYQLLVQGHLRNSDLLRARYCLARMQAAGFELNKTTYITVLGAYRSLGPNEGVEAQAFQALQGTGERSDTIILNGLMQLRIDDMDVVGALRVWRLFALPSLSVGDDPAVQESGNLSSSTPDLPFNPSYFTSPTTPPDNATFNILLTFLAQHRDDLHTFLRVFHQMAAAGLQADAETAAALVRAHATAQMTGTAVAIVEEMCKCHNLPVDSREFQLLGCRPRTVDVDILKTLSIRPTTQVFNALLRAVLPEHEIVGMQRVLRIMRQASVAPDASTTQIIVSYLDNVQHMRPRSVIRVLRTLATFSSDQASLTLQHANAILRTILNRERDIIGTKSWSATAQRVRFGHHSHFSLQRLSRTAPTFDPTAGIALTSFRRSTSELFQPIVQSLVRRHVMSDRMTFALRIRRDAVTRLDMQSAQRVFDIMIERGIRANAYHFSALIEGYVELGQMECARGVMDRASRAGVAPNVVMYTILIMGYGRLGRPDQAKRTFREMMSAGVKPDFAAVDAVVSAYWFVRAYGTARKLLLDLWPLVAPFPPELKDAPLHVLARSLRALRRNTRATIQPIESPRERQRRSLLRRKLDCTMSELKQWRRVLAAVSWARGDVGLTHMLYRDTSSKEGM